MNSEQWKDKFKNIIENLKWKWIEPHITGCNAGFGEFEVFEWWCGKRKITLDINEWGVAYTRVWGSDVNLEMEQGYITEPVEFARHYSWLTRSG